MPAPKHEAAVKHGPAGGKTYVLVQTAPRLEVLAVSANRARLVRAMVELKADAPGAKTMIRRVLAV